jgi:excinuclease ABC subunit C
MTDPSHYRPNPGSIPQLPGVYRFRDESGNAIYVGKAKNLRARLNTYFHDFSSLHPRTQQMVSSAASVDWVTVATEVEALVLEYSWIKEFSPRFNVRFRDDKSYPYLAITVSDQFPRISVVREAKRKGTKYFGPYAHVWAVRSTLEELVRIFPVRSCRDGVFRQAKLSNRACLLGHIGKCSAPCIGEISEANYRSLVNDLMAFLQGQSDSFVNQIDARMRDASEQQDYESAAKWRDRKQAIERVLERNSVVFVDNTDADVIGIFIGELDVGAQIFHVRGGRIVGERFISLDSADMLSRPEFVEKVITRIYASDNHSGVPREILISELPEDVDLVTEWLSELRGSKVEFRVPQRGDKRALMATALENAERNLDRLAISRSADITVRSQSLNLLQEYLGLDDPPLRIECIDISTLQGTDTVASLVVFEDAVPKKKDYRTFIIRGNRVDDLSAISEVVQRRFDSSKMVIHTTKQDTLSDSLHVSSETPTEPDPPRFAYVPSLLVVDGGKGQVDAAASAMAERGINIPIVGLAKRLEEIWVVGSSEPLILPRNSPALHLLQRIRDESHRVAIGLHRNRRGKRAIQSELDNVSGLGAVRKRALIQYFGSVKSLREATADEMAQVPGIGPVLAQSVFNFLHEEGP